MKNLLILACFFLLLSTAGHAQETSEVSSPEGDFSLAIPSTWQQSEPIDPSQVVYFLIKQDENTIGDCSIMKEILPLEISAKQYAAAAQENSLQELKGYTLVNEEELTIAGLPAIHRSFTFLVPVYGEDMEFPADQYYIVSGLQGYIISFSVIPHFQKTLQAEINTVLSSFLLLQHNVEEITKTEKK